MKLRSYRSTDLSRKTEISKSIVSEVLSGSRTAGPKTMAQLFLAFSSQADRRDLLVAFLADSLSDIGCNLHPPKKSLLIDEEVLSRIVDESGLASPKSNKLLHGPLWLDQLVEKAIEMGDSEENVLAIIRGKLEDYLAAKTAMKNR